jgi:hypothetical protein
VSVAQSRYIAFALIVHHPIVQLVAVNAQAEVNVKVGVQVGQAIIAFAAQGVIATVFHHHTTVIVQAVILHKSAAIADNEDTFILFAVIVLQAISFPVIVPACMFVAYMLQVTILFQSINVEFQTILCTQLVFVKTIKSLSDNNGCVFQCAKTVGEEDCQ